MERRDLRANYEEDLNRLKTAQRNAAIADLENTRNQALSNLEAEKNQNTSLYNQQRSTANAQNRMNAKNFQEYLAATGRANSGLSAQAKMQNQNNLDTNLNYLNAGEAGALADINRRTTDAQNAYNSGLASANANIEANYIQNLLDQRNQQLARDLQERQFQESIRQFNENLALQKQQLAASLSSGYSGTNSNDYTFDESNNNQKVQSDADIYGTFSNGYQPKGISGYGTLSKTGDTIKVGNKTQNVWKTKDGTLWYWDGSTRTYKKLDTGGGGGHWF